MRRLVLFGLVLLCTAAALRADIKLGDKDIAIVFSGDGKLHTIAGRDGLQLCEKPIDLLPFAVSIRTDDGKIVTVADEDVTFKGAQKGEGHTTFTYGIARYGLDVALQLSQHSPGVMKWSLRLTNRSGVRTWKVEFPRLRTVRIGKAHEDDVMIYPGSGGAFYIDKNFTRRRQFSQVGGGGLSMGWMDLYDETDGGFFVAEVSPVKKLFSLNADAMSNRNTSWNLSVSRYLTVPKDQSLTSEVLTGTHAGRWHAAADVYRTWYYKHFPEARYPDWAVNTTGWLHRPLSQGDDEPRATFDHYLRDAFDRARYYGTRFIGVWGNNTDIVPCGLFHYPSIRMGGPESVKKAMDDLAKKGGRATFYINCYRYSYEYGSKDHVGYCSKDVLPKDLPYRQTDWVLARAIRTPEGKLYGPSGAPYQAFQGICRMDYNSVGWQAHMLDTVTRHARWGVSLYLDESACSAKPNYADVPDPMAPGHENYPLGMLAFLKKAHEAAEPIVPGYAFAGERYYELYAPHIAFQTDGRFAPYVEACLYTHPSHLFALYHRAVPRNYEWVEKFRRAFVRGQPILFMGESGRRINLLQSAVVDLIRYQHGAVYRDDLGLEVTGKGVPGRLDPHSSRKTLLMRVKRWDINAEGRRVTTVNFHNYKSNPGLGIVVDPATTGKVKHALLYTEEGMVDSLGFDVQMDGRVAVKLPALPVGTVVLVGQERPEKAIRLTAWFDRTGADPEEKKAPEAVVIGLANVGDGYRYLKLTATTEHGLKLAVPETVSLKAGQVKRIRCRIENFDRIDRLTEVTVTASDNATTVSKTAFVMPSTPNRSFEVDDNQDGVPDNWLGPLRLDAETKTHGRVSAKLAWENRLPMTARVNPANPDEPMPEFTPAGEGEIRAVNYMFLQPGRTYRVSCDWRGLKYVGRSYSALRVHAVGSGSNAVLHQETVLRSPLAGSILAEMRPRPQWYDGKWRRLVAYLTTPEDFEQARVELVQVDSAEPVWFDNVRIEEVTSMAGAAAAGRVVGEGGVAVETAWHFMCNECGHTMKFADEAAAKKQRDSMPAAAGQGGTCPRCEKPALFAAEYCPGCKKVYVATLVKTPKAPDADDFCPHCKAYSPTGGDQ